jgi:hypothetical protein
MQRQKRVIAGCHAPRNNAFLTLHLFLGDEVQDLHL